MWKSFKMIKRKKISAHYQYLLPEVVTLRIFGSVCVVLQIQQVCWFLKHNVIIWVNRLETYVHDWSKRMVVAFNVQRWEVKCGACSKFQSPDHCLATEISRRHHCFPTKWRQRKECRNSILMTCHYPDPGYSFWSAEANFLRGTEPIRSTI